jgi:hypothetical protein
MRRVYWKFRLWLIGISGGRFIPSDHGNAMNEALGLGLRDNPFI